MAVFPKLPAPGALETVYWRSPSESPRPRLAVALCQRFPIVHLGALEIQVANANALLRSDPKLTMCSCAVLYQVIALQGWDLHSLISPSNFTQAASACEKARHPLVTSQQKN
jgi:hypothetical protein